MKKYIPVAGAVLPSFSLVVQNQFGIPMKTYMPALLQSLGLRN